MALEEKITELITSNNAMAQAMEGQASAIEKVLQKQDKRIDNKEKDVEQFLRDATPEARYEQTIYIGGSKELLYPVWWAFPNNSEGGGRITISRHYSKDSENHPLVPNIPHQAGLLLEIEGCDTAWGGDAKVFDIKRFDESYNKTTSHPSYRMYCKAEKPSASPELYASSNVDFTAQCYTKSGLYLRGGGLTYKIIKNWKGDVSYHDGSDSLRRDLGQHIKEDWGVVWYAEPIPFADILQPTENTNAYIDVE